MSAAPLAEPSRDVTACCRHCRHRVAEPQVMERALPGWASFGSAYGATVAASRLCRVHDCWVSPEDGCEKFSLVG